MGRWGYRLCEADADIDVACELGSALSKDTLSLQALIHQTDMLAPEGAHECYKTDEYRTHLAELVARDREKLDSGLGDKLIEKCISEQQTSWGSAPRRSCSCAPHVCWCLD
ncbi:hypothetical protein F4782DRAFT_357165 [Xylaria castorea]|nr:hypothetical protein F4782DRAFT_357165 [Xylaria castorea]